MNQEEKEKKIIKYSIIICTYNGSRTIGDCIESLLLQKIPKDVYEIIVVNDGSTDNVEKVVKRWIKPNSNLRLISYTKNKGLSYARNIGWQNAEGDIIFYIDDDAVADPDWTEKIVKHYVSDNIAGVGGYPRAYFENSLYSVYEIARCKLEYGLNAEILNNNNSGAGGCNMSLRKSVIEEVGGFDPVFTSVADDADINKRIAEREYRLLTVADITVRHRYPTNFKDYCNKKMSRGKGEYLYDKKYNYKYITLRSLAGIVLAFLNIPKNLIAGLKISNIANKHKLFPVFSILYAIDNFLTKYGKFKASINLKD